MVLFGLLANVDKLVTKPPMAKGAPRVQTSFRIAAELSSQLEATAGQTQRSPRQVVEICLDLVLPLFESGFLDSSEGNEFSQLLKKQIDVQTRLDRAITSLEKGSLIGHSEAPLVERALAVLRLDRELLKRIKAVSVHTGRNDRQVIEQSLQICLPLFPFLSVLKPRLVALNLAWEQYHAELTGSRNPSLVRREADALDAAQRDFLNTFHISIGGGINSEEDVQELAERDRLNEELTAIDTGIANLLFDWREKHGRRGFPRAFSVEQRQTDGKWIYRITDPTPAIPKALKKKSPEKAKGSAQSKRKRSS